MYKNDFKKFRIFIKFLNNSQFNSYCIFVDSDSTDGTKEILEEFSSNKDNVIYKNLDNLEVDFNNRIERIQISRNKCLEILINFDFKENIIYIPLDLDLDLFKYSSLQSFEDLVLYCINKNVPNGIFPFSQPYYYDIFALRASNWVNINTQYWVKILKNI